MFRRRHQGARIGIILGVVVLGLQVGRNAIWSTGLLRRLVNADPASPWLTAAIYPRMGGPVGYDDPVHHALRALSADLRS